MNDNTSCKNDYNCRIALDVIIYHIYTFSCYFFFIILVHYLFVLQFFFVVSMHLNQKIEKNVTEMVVLSVRKKFVLI